MIGDNQRFSLEENSSQETDSKQETDFKYTIDRFADLKVMRYTVPEWESLSRQQKELLYYLSEAANCGRDILYAQNFRYNLLIKHCFEAIYRSFRGSRDTEGFKAFETYLKRFWFSNGIHHHYSCDKFEPGFTEDYLKELFQGSDLGGVWEELSAGNRDSLVNDEVGDEIQNLASVEDLYRFLVPILFDKNLYAKRINLDPEKGLLEGSASHYYVGLTTQEAEEFYQKAKEKAELADPDKAIRPLSYGINSRLEKHDGEIVENVCRVGGLYSKAIEKIVFWLEKAASVAESPAQKRHIELLVEYYRTGSLQTWDDFNIAWVEDSDCFIDYNNGFIEVYGDPLGLKASWEAISNFRDRRASERTRIISGNAQWFEDHSPVDPRFRKEKVKGVSAKVINVVQLGGDCFPSSPIGINLPNADWIRHEHGSKSVTIENLCYAYDRSSKEGKGALDEFVLSQEEKDRCRAYSYEGGNLHTDLHECLGHGSGRLLEGVAPDALKNYASTLEEARADLFALYYLADPKMQELGLVRCDDVYKAEYDSYIRNGLLTQMVRIELGKDFEEAHMRNRALVARWVYEYLEPVKGIERLVHEGKTYFRINDYQALRDAFGKLLAEIQRIKSEGDFEAGKALVEKYGVKIDPELHREVLDRYSRLGLAPYGGFVNPVLEPVYDAQGKVQDVRLGYVDDFASQMMEYAGRYSFLPIDA